MKTLDAVVKSGLCLGCGGCIVDPKVDEIVFNPKSGQYIPSGEGLKKSNSDGFFVCPGKGYDILEEAKKLYPRAKPSLELGRVFGSYVIRSISKTILKNASSGGLMTSLLIFLLEKKLVDKVVVTKFIYTDDGLRTKTFLTNSVEDILDSQGSKYCPVNINEAINEIKEFDGKIAFVGTPCHIASIRKIQAQDESFNLKIAYTIANFCGGFKNYNNIKILARRNKIDFKNISFFRFRGGGQPGSLKMQDKKGGTLELKYPYKGANTGLSKHLRCHLCVDATGELADFSCGDAWLSKYLESEFTWSIVLSRNEPADKILSQMQSEGRVFLESLSLELVKESQKVNLKSKKFRQKTRTKLYKKMGYCVPVFDGGCSEVESSMKLEVKVLLTHKIKEVFERLRIFDIIKRMFHIR